jgi:iron(III) transport system substrate-binding protein
MLANEPRTYDGNDAILAAIAAGEIEVGLVNHYYALRQQDEQGAEYPVANHFFAGGDPGALINVAGAGVLTTAPNPAAAEAFITYLLSEDGQAYFAGETFEYPLVEGVDSDAAVVPLADIEAPDVDLSDLASLAETLTLLQETGVL